MKTKRDSTNTAAPAAAEQQPLEAQTLKAPADSGKRLHIPPELTTPNERRAFALAYRRTLDGRKLDYMPGSLIAALCKGIAAAVFHAERIARETGIAAEAIAAALTGATPEEPNRKALLDAGAPIDG